MKNNYVYVYKVGGRQIYVGIGTDKTGTYVRATNIAGHSEVAKLNLPDIEISIVATKLTRDTARVLEAVLISQLSPHTDLLNVQRTSLLQEAQPLVINRSGVVQKRLPKDVQQHLKGHYEELMALWKPTDRCPLEDWQEACMRDSGYVPLGMRTEYPRDKLVTDKIAYDRDQHYSSHNRDTDAALPFDDTSASINTRIRDFLDHFAYGNQTWYEVGQIKRLAYNRSVREFCAYLDLYFSAFLYEGLDNTDKYSLVELAAYEKFREWISTRRMHTKHLPALTATVKIKYPSDSSWFTNLYHFICTSHYGPCPDGHRSK